MNVLSLFSGIGGLELGLERAGMTVVGQVEIDPFCRRVLAKHWPDVPRHDDVRTCVEWWRSGPRPAVHVVAGGFPCQPVSVAGRQRAQADERWLWPAMWSVIRDLRPGWVLLENVPGLLGRGMGDVLGDLAAGGYDAEWDCIPAAAIGAHHRRDRVFIVAYAAGSRRATGARGAGGQARHEARRTGPDGLGGQVAHSNGAPRRSTAGDATSSDSGAPLLGGGPPEPRGRGCVVADPDDAGSQWPRLPDARRGPGFSDAGRSGPIIFRRPLQRGGEWAPEPDVGRVAHGVPARVDRLRSLGNAVVPQVAEHIGRLVMGAAS